MTKPPFLNTNHRDVPTTPMPSLLETRLTDLARAAGARRFGETPPAAVALPLPDAALVVGLALQCVKQNGRVPASVRDALERLAASGEPTSRTVLAWINGQPSAKPRRGGSAR